eukprot:CAMPEP_0185529642 /NCGR_PEP_ID=MMETSP1366-20130426/101909_1 /TAXON_ID=38817 /ORGANISM="Gephyrocapsa oceanica, Strain RCC1303" /LENGTH=81 /DNA_ID=CAMNT_0028141267 /DNA_START=14 /DNA_END=256 /DNA_ORIENTATION=-
MTSGTTGAPKTVLNPHVSYAAAAAARAARYPYGSAEREAVGVMFAWEAARPLCFGQTAIIVPDEALVDPPRLAALLAEARA